jgi:hypothetical protein
MGWGSSGIGKALVCLWILACVTSVGCRDYARTHGEAGTPVAEVIERFGPPTVDTLVANISEGPNECDDVGATRELQYHVPPSGTLEWKILGPRSISVLCVDVNDRVISNYFIEF